MMVYVVGRYVEGQQWEFQGVFSTEALAVEECGDRRDWFVGPAEMDVSLPSDSHTWPECYYPASRS